ncbi:MULTISPECIES: condensation domain-containing protein [unclassified Streptomyces]|uniref:condensation domain-containing protein n=1 Tax=unclassified Streptomyces TaxID=2593676 RepID=UPI002E804A89|nr:condensation domain-containing protein [Streptomyces sp. NBC_00589]WTI34632.1 condensation domain-containing protein [Streptomyces sp. NBC_00775]WUB31695.1 condensation domain-containing protein [Streptomyces sp. NBC_00589]
MTGPGHGWREEPVNWPQLDWQVGWRVDQPPSLHRTDSHVYNLVTGVAATGSTRDQVRAAVRALITRHEALRTLLVPGDGPRDVQWVAPAPTSPADLEPLLEFAPADEGAQRFRSLRRTDFDLERQWPLKVLVAEDRGAVTEIGVVADHAAVDGWGIEILRNDLARFLTAARRGHAPEEAFGATELPMQPREVARWERSSAGHAHLERALAVWRDQLSGLRAADVPHVGTPARAGDPPPRYRSCVMGSTRLLQAADRGSAALRVPVSTLFLTALGHALCDVAGAVRVGLQAHFTNRLSPAHRRSVSTLFLRGPMTVERTPRVNLADAARALYPIQLRGAIAANVDRLRVEELKQEIYAGTQASVLTGAWLNYQDLSATRDGGGPPALLGPLPARPPADDRIRTEGLKRRGRPFVLKVDRFPDQISLHLLWQEGVVPADFAEAVLGSLTERVLNLAPSL